MTTKIPGIPAVPPTDAAMYSFLQALKANIEVLTGQVGDGSFLADKVVNAVLDNNLQGDGTDTTPPGPPSGVAYEASVGTIFLSWSNPSDTDLDKIEIWESATNNRAAAVRVGTPAAMPNGKSSFARTGFDPGITRYYWLRAIDKSRNPSGWSHPDTAGFAATTVALHFSDFPADLEPVGVVTSLPTVSGYTGPKTVRLSTDGKLYRLVGGAWTAAVAAVDLTGQITTTQIGPNAVTTPKLAAGAVTANEIAAGTITGDRLVTGTISSAYIAANAIDTTRLAAGAVVASKIASGTITADRIVTNEIDTQYLKNSALANAGIVDVSGSTAVGTSPYTNIGGGGVYVEARGGMVGYYTTIQMVLFVDAVNLDTSNSVGLWVDVVLSGAVSDTVIGGAMTIAPYNSNSMCVPLYYRTSATGSILAAVGGYVTLAGGSSSMVNVTRTKLVPLAIYKS